MTSALPASALDLLLDEFVDRVADRVVHRLEAREPRPETELLNLTEAAEVLRCKPQRIYQLRSTGRLPRTVEGGRAIVRRSDIERLIEEDSA
jgi:predicted DNA-binding transcriptional regulator AlpA